MQVFRRLADLYDTDVNSPLNMGYFCIDADAASIAAMDETNRRGANVAVRGQHPASAAFEQYGVDLIMETFGIDPESGAGHFTACGTEANQTAMIVALTDRLSHRNPALHRLRPGALQGCVRARRALRVLAPRLDAAAGAACPSMSRPRPTSRSRRTRATWSAPRRSAPCRWTATCAWTWPLLKTRWRRMPLRARTCPSWSSARSARRRPGSSIRWPKSARSAAATARGSTSMRPWGAIAAFSAASARDLSSPGSTPRTR